MESLADNLPALADAYGDDTHPLHKMLFRVADNVDLEFLLEEWATENPAAFLRILMALTPNPVEEQRHDRRQQQNGRPAGGVFQLHLHPSLAPGPLDQGEAIDGEYIQANDDRS